MKNKNYKLLESFVAYCNKYPELRFWQALCGWAESEILVNIKPYDDRTTYEDPFYWKGKKG